MNNDREQPDSRRDAFRRAGRWLVGGGLAVLGGLLASRRRRANDCPACAHGGACRGCPVFAHCGLPEARAARRAEK